VNLVDSSGWLEFFTAGANANFFAPSILKTADLVVPTVSLYEVYRKVVREQGEGPALRVIAQMKQGQVVNLDETVAIKAARLSLKHQLPMANALIYATAQVHKSVLWTQDEHFKGLPGVQYTAKPTKP
jgi:predicted nucleic acid-binding protein